MAGGLIVLPVACENPPKPNGGAAGPSTVGRAVADFTLGDLEKLRTRTEFYVKKVRQLMPPRSAETLECERRYAFSQASVNGAIVDLQNLVLAGRDPAGSLEFGQKAAQAREEVNGFVNYADGHLLRVVAPGETVTVRSPGGEVSERAFPFAFLGVEALASLGSWSWKQWKAARTVSTVKAEEAAKRLAAGFDKQRWRDFDDIVSGKK